MEIGKEGEERGGSGACVRETESDRSGETLMFSKKKRKFLILK